MKDFNADFYVTAATVIPVLYLALAVQGSTFDAMSKWLYGVIVRRGGKVANFIESHPRFLWLRRIPKGFGVKAAKTLTVVPAFLIVFTLALSLIGSLIGEFIAIRALYQRKATPWQAQYVLISVIVLASVIALVTSGRLVAAFLKLLAIRRRNRRDRESAIEIDLKGTSGMPFIQADYVFQISKEARTRDDALKLAERMIANFPPEAELRPGTPPAEDILKAVDEAFPP
jgi:hypothetical protein